jgi:hypothetical protein
MSGWRRPTKEVADAEDAVGQEHTMWRVSRGAR